MKRLTNKEIEFLNIKGKFDTLFIHDIENTIGFKKPDHKSKDYFLNLLKKLDRELGVKDNDLVVMAGNKNLLDTANQVYYQDTPCEEIILPAGGKDGADLKLLASIQRLFALNHLRKFKKIVIVSGDHIFSNWVSTLKRQGLNIETVSLKENTCREFRVSNSHSFLRNIFAQSSQELNYV